MRARSKFGSIAEVRRPRTHDSRTTQRAYRKEAEGVILLAVLERGRALASLTAEDAIAYRAFLRRLAP